MQVAVSFDLTLLFMCLMRWSSFTQSLQFVFVFFFFTRPFVCIQHTTCDSIYLMNNFPVFYLSCADFGCIYYFIIYCSGGEIIFLLCFLLVFSFICVVVL